ncbi:MAG: hypothetical protein HRT57_15270 [Crocinitomicaceae bacterium]|nr:hypothetical protein [Crocinitomicaceae bacterium]
MSHFNLSPGMYILNIKSQKGRKTIKRIKT